MLGSPPQCLGVLQDTQREAFQGLPRPQVDRKMGGKLLLLQASEGDTPNTRFRRVEGWDPVPETRGGWEL